MKDPFEEIMKGLNVNEVMRIANLADQDKQSIEELLNVMEGNESNEESSEQTRDKASELVNLIMQAKSLLIEMNDEEIKQAGKAIGQQLASTIMPFLMGFLK